MHITVSRVLGFLLFLALIGYAFFFGPRISALSLGPDRGIGADRSAPAAYAAPRTPAPVPPTSAE